MKIAFTIDGNHKDIGGNPIPYKRLVRGSFRKGDSNYLEWEEYVRSRFYATARIIDADPDILAIKDGGRIIALYDQKAGIPEKKPIDISTRLMQLDLRIGFKNGAHGDPDNIFKGIADALFINDKNLYGTFPVPEHGARAPDGKGKVEALLTITKISP